jgi:hypothetical protein
MNKAKFNIVSIMTIVGFLCTSARAEEDFTITLVQPGAGFLVAGEESRVPLEIILRSDGGSKKLKRVSIDASLGKTSKIRIVAKNRLLFMYTPPRSPIATDEVLDVELRFSDGSQVTQGLGFRLAKPQAPNLNFTVSDISMDASQPKRINLSANASGDNIRQLEIFTSHGTLDFPGAISGSASELFAGATLTPPLNMPAIEPSHFMLLSVAASTRGFAASVSGVSTFARVRLRAELPRGSKLVIEGTRDNPPPVAAPADGFTTSYGVIEYGQPVRAYQVRGRRKKEISVTIPTGLVPDGMAVAIPGQDIADGGTGPTVLVAIPPSPFGEELYWPEIEVEGATKIRMFEVSDQIRALSFTRPIKPQTFTVLADRAPIGTIEFKSSHAARLELETSFIQNSERGAIIAHVFDPMGGRSDHPAPVARIENGPDLPVKRTEPGKFRIIIPSNVPGETGDEVRIEVELPALNIVHGDPPELIRSVEKLKLEGPPPAIRADDSQEPTDTVSAGPSNPSEPLGLNLYAMFSSGFMFAPIVNLGTNLRVEFRLPPMDKRFSLIGGIEYTQSGNDGFISFGNEQTLAVEQQHASLVVPVEVGFQVWASEDFELSLRAGPELRIDYFILDQDGVRIAGSEVSQIAGRATMSFAYALTEVLAAVTTLGARGLGASANTGGSSGYEFDGGLMQAYLDLGLRVSM